MQSATLLELPSMITEIVPVWLGRLMGCWDQAWVPPLLQLAEMEPYKTPELASETLTLTPSL